MIGSIFKHDRTLGGGGGGARICKGPSKNHTGIIKGILKGSYQDLDTIAVG